jgi:hypothetical protein
MPLGASSLNTYALIDRIGEAIELDPASPSGLRWRDTWVTLRNEPLGTAGRWDEKHKSWVVTANRVPMHCRHAVWMLTNLQPIPDDRDIGFADGNPHNLSPGNLVVVSKLVFRNRSIRRQETALPRVPHAYTVATMNNTTLFGITLHLGKRTALMALSPSREHAAMYLLIIGHHFGALSSCPKLPLPDDVVAHVRSLCAGLGPTPADLSGSEQEAARRFRTALNAEMPLIVAALGQRAPAPRPTPVLVRPPPGTASGTPILDMLDQLDPQTPVPAPNRAAGAISQAPEYPGGFDPLSTLPRAGE